MSFRKWEKLLFLALLTLVAVIAVASLWPTFQELAMKWKIQRAVANAKTIRLEQYRNQMDMLAGENAKEQVIITQELSVDQFHEVAEAFPFELSATIPGNILKCIFDPHHRIIITDAAGNRTTIEVCFMCDAIQVADSGNNLFLHSPNAWKESLRHFFAEHGMPENRKLYMPPAAEPASSSSGASH